MLRFFVLGPVEVTANGQTVPIDRAQRRAIFAYLLLHMNEALSVDQLVDALWGAAAPATARPQIFAALSTIRRALRQADRDPIATVPGGYRLTAAAEQLDLAQFRDLVSQSRDEEERNDLESASKSVRAALQLWRGNPLVGITADFVESARSGLREQRLVAQERLFELELALGRHQEIVAEISALAAANPLRERLAGHLMTALYRCGRQADALAVYRSTRQQLVEELGIDPTPQLEHLHKQVLDRSPGLAVPQRRSTKARRFLPRGIPDFVGRADHLARLDSLATSAETAAGAFVISAIAGAGGVGKTALAVHWAHKNAFRFPDGQLYFDLRGYDRRNAMEPIEALGALLKALDIPPDRVPNDLDEASALYRATLSDQKVLLLLDNACSVDQVRPLLLTCPGSVLLVTSRNTLEGLVVRDGARRLTVEPMSPPDAFSLLSTLLGPDRIAEEPQAIVDLANACGHLPLALRIAAAHLVDRRDQRVEGYVRELVAGERLSILRVEDDPLSSLRVVISWSVDALSNAAAQLLRLLAVPPGPDISVAAAASLAGDTQDQILTLLHELSAAHLLKESTPGRYSMHDLVRDFAAEMARKLDSRRERDASWHRVLDFYVHTAFKGALLLHPHRMPISLDPVQRGVEPERLKCVNDALSWFDGERRVLQTVITQASDDKMDRHAWQLTWAFGYYLHRCGHWRDWLHILRSALPSAQRLGTADAVSNVSRGLARALTLLGEHREALIHLKDAAALCEKEGHDPGRAMTYQHLAEVHWRQQEGANAVRYAQQALELYRRIGDRPGEAAALNNLGWYLCAIDQHREAIRHCLAALAIEKEIDDKNAEASTWDTLGYAYHGSGSSDTAMLAYQRALKLYRELGRRYPETTTLSRLGDIYFSQGDHDAAHEAWQQALSILEELGHADAKALQQKVAAARECRLGDRPASPCWASAE